MSHLVSYKQIEGNLRRTADNGLISLLNQKQLEDLAFKYFSAIDEKTGLPGYQCPYSGEVYTNYEDIVLEHIIPVASKGGTVLFNCIPTSKEVNGSDQKGAKHLITWWIKSKYWDEDAPSRLEKIVNYMLDGYERVFEEYTMEEVESSYQDIEQDENILDEQQDIEKDIREEKKLLKQAKDNGIHSYLGFMLDCINTLDIYNIDTTEIRNKLKSLEDKHIFEDIDKYQLYQNIVQKIIISRIGDDSRSYLTYTLNIDISKLMDSINLENEQDIYNEINSRLINIENLLQENNLSTIEYFKSLKDIQDIDIIYKNNILEQDINVFLENIKIGIDTKIEIFIRMLNKGNSLILTNGNKETLEGYSNINLTQFWNRHQNKIKIILFEKEKNNPKYETARQTILKYFNVSNYEELIAKQDEFRSKRELDLDTKIEIFIDMLNKGQYKILIQGNKETLEGYPNIRLYHYWKNYQDKIKNILFEKEKDNPKYETARQTILKYFNVSNYEELIAKQDEFRSKRELDSDIKILIFIRMLNKGQFEILKVGNNEILEGHPNVRLSNFWNYYQDKIKNILFEKEKNNPKYETARQTILKYFNVKSYEELTSKQDKFKSRFELDLDNKIDIFIKMLNKGNNKILEHRNNEFLEGYPNVALSQFWHHYKVEINSIIFEKEKKNPEFEVARQTILKYFNVRNYEELIAKQDLNKKIEVFINMLNKGQYEILKHRNKETLEGYSEISLSRFWENHQEKIKNKLFEDEKDNPKYETARQTILKHFNVRNYEELIAKQDKFKSRFEQDVDTKIEIFIDMLNKGNIKILKYGNKETLEGYPNVSLSQFWQRYQDKIKSIVFEDEKDNPKYETARQTILKYFNVSNYEELIAKQDEFRSKRELDSKEKIEIFIDMLNKGNAGILKQGNKETLEGYSNIKLSHFWNSYNDKIKTILFENEKNNLEFETARQTILTYFDAGNYEELEFKSNLHLRITCFIKMLNEGKIEILKNKSEEFFEGYPNTPVGQFWSKNKYREIIVQTLFDKLRNNHSYDTARGLILTNLKVDTIEEYYEQRESKKKKVKDDKKLKKELEETIKMVDTIYEQLNIDEEQRKRA